MDFAERLSNCRSYMPTLTNSCGFPAFLLMLGPPPLRARDSVGAPLGAPTSVERLEKPYTLVTRGNKLTRSSILTSAECIHPSALIRCQMAFCNTPQEAWHQRVANCGPGHDIASVPPPKLA